MAKCPQASGDATVWKRFLCDNFAIFRRRIKKNRIFEISEFFYVSICKFSIFMMVT